MESSGNRGGALPLVVRTAMDSRHARCCCSACGSDGRGGERPRAGLPGGRRAPWFVGWLGVVSAVDLGFIFAILLPGYIRLVDGLWGPALWVSAVIFSTIGLLTGPDETRLTR